MKICVIGYSGAGKSTLAQLLGNKYNLPVLHMDATYWYGDWQSRTREEQTEEVERFLTENPEGWVVDCNYFKICPQRFSLCDEVYFLNYNRFFCFNQAVKRYKKYKGSVRPDCPCVEKFDFEFAWWVFFGGRSAKRRKQYKVIVKKCKSVKTFKSRKQLERYLNKA